MANQIYSTCNIKGLQGTSTDKGGHAYIVYYIPLIQNFGIFCGGTLLQIVFCPLIQVKTNMGNRRKA